MIIRWKYLNNYARGFLLAITGLLILFSYFFLPENLKWVISIGFFVFFIGFGMMFSYKFGGQEKKDYENSKKPGKQPWEE